MASLIDIAEADLVHLIETREPESQILEFKRDLPDRGNEARKEFLADVCAFANATGGDLLYGVEEDGEARAKALRPVTPDNVDEEQRRLQDWILNGLDPRVTGVEVLAVPVTGGYVFVVRVPGSWNAPHRIKTNQHFYLREGARKRPLDVPEIRSAFLRSENQADRVRNFRADRVGKILTGQTPAPLFEGPIGVLHVVPLQPASASTPVDPRPYTGPQARCLPLVSSQNLGLVSRMNLDGAVIHRPVTDRGCGSYTILFRDGTVEAVTVFPVHDGAGVIPSHKYEQDLVTFFRKMEDELHRLLLGPPYAVLYSLLRVLN
ncbi:MAG: AlbA family DNA-binding domain-containing protein, partial [Thermoplasmataceae archaeon]